MNRSQNSFLKLWGIPLLLAALTLLGLLSALLGDGLWDALSWTALAIPVLVLCRYVFGRQRA
ncbi:hypothetical protein [Compostibacter hankyongensis]|uniref:DUF4175 domain-containing protein n=1 Tax=Compostibacter hankyongensis TaxID=1007089 RepID=A0ABP8FSF1_9BACT